MLLQLLQRNREREGEGVSVIYMYEGIHKLISCCKCDWRKGNGTANKAKDNGRLETRVCSSRTILAHTQAHTHTHTDSKTDTHTNTQRVRYTASSRDKSHSDRN